MQCENPKQEDLGLQNRIPFAWANPKLMGMRTKMFWLFSYIYGVISKCRRIKSEHPRLCFWNRCVKTNLNLFRKLAYSFEVSLSIHKYTCVDYLTMIRRPSAGTEREKRTPNRTSQSRQAGLSDPFWVKGCVGFALLIICGDLFVVVALGTMRHLPLR